MNKIINAIKKKFRINKTALIYNNSRRNIMFIGMNIILALVSFIMTLVNLFTKEYLLLAVTLTFSLLCFLNLIIVRTKFPTKLIHIGFCIEALTMIVFFLVSGIPNGFSALWICLIPSFAMLIFGISGGVILSVISLAILAFLFWIPAGNALLRFEYTETFLLRFPLFYGANFVLSLLVEFVRSETHKQLMKAEQDYKYLYRHDALTGLYNRYVFNELIERSLSTEKSCCSAIVIIDIDDFKRVNDSFGHCAGDEVLRRIAHTISDSLCGCCKCCRWGGEEFMIMMNCKHNAEEIAEDIRKSIENSEIIYEGYKIKVTVSIGICIGEKTVTQLIDTADKNLYISKKSGKNCITVTVL